MKYLFHFLLLSCCVCLIPFIACAASANVPKTGQTTSYSPGDDGNLQKGVAIPSPRFTNNGDGTVTDNLTDLIWLRDANCIHTEYPAFDTDTGDGRVTWQRALDFIAGINNGTYPACGAGQTDWRLPNRKELWSLINFNYTIPAISNAAGNAQWSAGDPFLNIPNSSYLSSTTSVDIPAQKWIVNISDGDLNQVSHSPGSVWPVRAGQGGSPNKLNISLSGNGPGTVTSNPPGITCGGSLDCSETYPAGTEVTLTATPATVHVTFDGWSGDPDCTDGSVTMNGVRNCTATFTIVQQTITTSASPAEGGSISCTPNPVDSWSTSTCTITTNSGYSLTSVDGTCGGNLAGSTYTTNQITSSCTVNSNYSLNLINITRDGTGSGTVTSSPVGIDCGNDCSQIYDYATPLTLTAAPDTGSTFVGWSGGSCSGVAPCTFSVEHANTITATFDHDGTSQELTVATAGICFGTIISTSSGINCGNDCNETYLTHTNVELTATPMQDCTFSSWSGNGCSGTGSCSFFMDQNESITATFDLFPFALMVLKTGKGTGTVLSDASGINCGSDCSEIYTEDDIITLMATPDNGSMFNGWSGGCTGLSPCTITISQAKMVTADFGRYFPWNIFWSAIIKDPTTNN